MDYGAGSGILSLAACKLGAKQVFAIDLDPQALEACRANAGQNNIKASTLRTYLPIDAPMQT